MSRLFKLIGKLFFPNQQEWKRRRSAKIMLAVVVVSLLVGIFLWKAMIYMNSK